MRSICRFLLVAVSGIAFLEAQTPVQATPQTAREALLEMFTENTPKALEKHLPGAARTSLLQDADVPPLPVVREFLNFRADLAGQKEHISTFTVGPTLLSMEEVNGHKVEVTVERDDWQGEADEIELSFHSYRDGIPEPLPVVPQLMFSMKQEKGIWTLNEITLTVRVPLGDPEYVKGLQKSQNGALESSAAANLRTLNTAEINYAAAFPDQGYTCELSTLGGAGAEPEATAEHAMLIDDNLASGKKGGYVFSISGCDTRPASNYRVTAVPSEPESGLRAFCSDESAVIRYSTDGKANTCMIEGAPLQ